MRRTRIPFPRLWPFLFSCFFCGLVFTEVARAHAVANPHYTFLTAKERDAESNLDYFGARYFSGAQGRFTGPDTPLLDQRSEEPQSWSLYSYVRNNPLIYVDPNGQDCVYTNNFSSDGTVTVQRGDCTQNGGTFVNGTIDLASLSYDPRSNSLGFGYANESEGTGGTGTIGLPAVPRDQLRPEVVDALREAGHRAGRATYTGAVLVGMYSTILTGTYVGPAIYVALMTGGEAGFLRFGKAGWDIVRDVSGKVHSKVLPRFVPKNLTRDELEFAARELRASIQVRQQEMLRLGEKGGHGLRIAHEQQLLYRIEQRLGKR